MTSHTRRRSLALLLMLGLLGTVLLRSEAAAQSQESPEAMAVLDITAIASCETTWEVYTDPERTRLVERQVRGCPAGSVISTKRMSEAQAKAQGHRYVRLTGDADTDRTMVDSLKAQIRREANPPNETTTPSASVGNRGTEAFCNVYYYFRSVEYNTYEDPGGRVKMNVWYNDKPGDCDRIIITTSTQVFVQAPNAGQDLFWDRQMVTDFGAILFQRSMGCAQIYYPSPTTVNGNSWDVLDDLWLVDETINDTSFGCTWWGEEFQGSVQLLTN